MPCDEMSVGHSSNDRYGLPLGQSSLCPQKIARTDKTFLLTYIYENQYFPWTYEFRRCVAGAGAGF